LSVGRSLPICPQLRTFSVPVGMSQNGMDWPCSRPEPLKALLRKVDFEKSFLIS